MLYLSLGVLLACGLLILSSISMHLFWLQAAWIAAGIILAVVLRRLELKGFLRAEWFAWTVYSLSVLLLIAAYLSGTIVRNTKSWLVLGPVQFQPVELAKIALILVFSAYFSRRHISIARFKHILLSFLVFAVPAGITFLAPDLGQAAILFGIWFGYLLVSGLPRRFVLGFFAVFAITAFLGWSYLLKDYQRARITGFIYPEKNVLGINYQVTQSKIAIGSAGFWGKGYGQGSQVQLGFLTEPATDFVFASFIEEWGLFAGMLIVAAFIAFILSILRLSSVAKSNVEKLIALGAAMVFGLQFFMNTGSVVGLFPVVGLTFPFVSYGGSSMFVNFFLFSIVNTIYAES